MISPTNIWRDIVGEEIGPDFDYHQDPRDSGTSKVASYIAAFVALALGIIYSLLHSLDYNLLSLPELLWNVLVYITPSQLLNFLDRTTATSDSDLCTIPRTHAAKSEILRRLLGLNMPGGIMGTVAQAGRRRLSSLPGLSLASQDDRRPAGLGNWDNSCYQNSVLQGLASLDSLPNYLVDPANNTALCVETENPDMKMADSLRLLISRLNDPLNNGKRIWTPATLKSMSSWQQQDAQEYFSKVLDEVDKEIIKAARSIKPMHGFATDQKIEISEEGTGLESAAIIRNPLEGLLAQRVGCIRCGYSEGLSMIPFNCLTVPLGKEWSYDISTCLDEYTKLEPIDGVECGKCTLLKTQRLLNVILDRSKDTAENNTVHSSTLARLQTVNEALEDDDYEDKTLTQKCKISPKNRVTTTKSRQAVIARPPRSLAIHVNRSLFDEITGELKKNYAEVRFPRRLDIGAWCLGSSGTSNNTQFEEWLLDPAQSMIAGQTLPSRIVGPIYELRAVVTHYGRHENGHYIAYRKHPSGSDDKNWWRLSDDDVTKVSEENVLGQGGVFMLFYDCIEPSQQAITHNTGPVSITDITLPVTIGEDLENSSENNDETSPPTARSTTTSVSEEEDVSPEQEYQPAKAIVLPRVRSRVYHDNEEKNDSVQASGSMVMV